MGRGIIYLTISRIFFAISGFIINVVIARALGVEEYGIYGVVTAFLNITYILYQPGMQSAVTKFTSEDNDLAKPVLKTALKVQSFFAIIVTFLIIISSPLIAGFLKDKSLGTFLAIAALSTIPTALTTIYQASLNGLRQFGRLSVSITAQSFFKIIIIVIIVFTGFRIKGVIYGLTASALAGMIISAMLCKPQPSERKFEISKIFSFASKVLLYVFCVNSIMSIDLLLIKSIIGNNSDTGLYTCATNIAKVPFVLFSGLPTVILPSISRAVAINDSVRIKKYLNQSVRYLLILITPIAVILSASSKGLIELLYSAKFIDASIPLSILIFGISFSTVLALFSSIIIGSGKPLISMYISLFMLPLDILMNYICIKKFGITGAAVATTFTFLAGTLAMAIYIYLKFHTLISIKSIFKISGTGIILYLISLAVAPHGFFIFFEYPMLFAVYIIILIGTGELGKTDIQKAKELMPI